MTGLREVMMIVLRGNRETIEMMEMMGVGRGKYYGCIVCVVVFSRHL